MTHYLAEIPNVSMFDEEEEEESFLMRTMSTSTEKQEGMLKKLHLKS